MLKGKTALITGSNRGIGKALVRQFAHNGADIIAHARRETSDFMQMCIEISDAYSVKVMPLFFDMTDSAAMKSALRGLMSSKVPVNVLVNNAGVAHGGLFQMTSITVIREIFDINLFSQMELTQYLLRYMCKWSNACIINMGSVLGMNLPRGSCGYGLSKAALMGFTQILAAECAPLGVRVNAVAPGLVDTDMANLMESGAEEIMMNQCAMKRRAQPKEISEAVVFLASAKSSFINGQVLRIDGGKA